MNTFLNNEWLVIKNHLVLLDKVLLIKGKVLYLICIVMSTAELHNNNNCVLVPY
jgi:hypothetical protein